LARPQRLVSAALVAVVAVAGLLAAGRWLQPRLDRETPVMPSTRSPPTSSVLTSPTVVTATRPPGSPGITKTADTALVDAIAVTPRAVWIAAGGLVMRIDPATRRKVVVPDIETVEPPVVELTAGAGAVWAATTAGRQLLRIDPRTARVAASLPVPATAVAADSSGVWAVCCEAGARGGQLTRIDPTSNRVVATIRLPSSTVDTGEPGGDIAVTEDAVWVSDPATATVWRINSRRNQVTDERWEADGSDLAVTADGVVWATSDTRLLGLGGWEVRGPRRNLHELDTDRITATAAARDGGLWLGTAQGLFHLTRSVLREG
jgi:ligand-binding sensor domain-containing protein